MVVTGDQLFRNLAPQTVVSTGLQQGSTSTTARRIPTITTESPFVKAPQTVVSTGLQEGSTSTTARSMPTNTTQTSSGAVSQTVASTGLQQGSTNTTTRSTPTNTTQSSFGTAPQTAVSTGFQQGSTNTTASMATNTTQTSSGAAPQTASSTGLQQGSTNTTTTSTPTITTETSFGAISSDTIEKKGLHYFTSVIKIAFLKDGSQSSKIALNVIKLIQNLLNGTIEVEEFYTQLQKELNHDFHSFVDFLKKNLPVLRQSLMIKERIDAIRSRLLSVASVPATDTPTVVKNPPVDASTQTKIELPTEKLIYDLTEMFKREKHSDIIIRVKDEEFRLHRNILACRSPYFRSMFEAEMKDNATNVVIIDDCEVDVFRNYALFLYTGKVEEMTIANVCDLYEVAVKYKEDQLKEECLCFIKTKMSVENFCDFIVLALKHDDKELFQTATDLFCRQTIKIIEKNVKWQTFMTEYPAQANELYIKAHKTVEHRLNNDEVMSKKRRMNDNDI